VNSKMEITVKKVVEKLNVAVKRHRNKLHLLTELTLGKLRELFLAIGHQCRSCDNLVEDPKHNLLWCDACFAFFDSKQRCMSCGLTIGDDSQHQGGQWYCGECLTKPPKWERLYCVSDYDAPLKSDVYRLKYKHDAQIASDLGQLVARRLKDAQVEEYPTALIVVPVPWYRLWRRGYNQSLLLANAIRKQMRLTDHEVSILQPFGRRSVGFGHTRMKRGERLKKSASEFYLKPRLAKSLSHHSHVAIVDDVVTTGATVKQLSTLLLEKGVQRIDIYCVCRTEKPN
jgi:ComF family protein